MMSLEMTWLLMLGLDKSLSKMLEHKSAYLLLPQLPLEKKVILDISSLTDCY